MFAGAMADSVAQWTSRLPQELKTLVRIPPGWKVFVEKIIILLYVTDLLCMVCVEKEN
jgi:hypothetical protein